MPDKNILKSYMARHNDTQKSLAKYLEISERTMWVKYHNPLSFSFEELLKIKAKYKVRFIEELFFDI